MIPFEVSASTRVLALLGDPVAHSLSPRIHNAALRAAGLDAVYVALRCSQSDAGALLRLIAHAGGAGNVTIPHKLLAAGVLDRKTDAVVRTGACNTFWLEDGVVWGDNTDVAGFKRAAGAFHSDLAGARALLLGAGGAARAVIAALDEIGVQDVDVVNRTAERGHQLAAFAGDSLSLHVHADERSLDDEPFDLVVNATALGLHPDDALPFDLTRLGRVGAVMDLTYSAHDTALVAAARSLGIPAQDGREMLLHQAAAAFQRWWSLPAPLDVMRAALAE